MAKIIRNRTFITSTDLPSYINTKRGNQLVTKNSAPKQITTFRFGNITTSSIDLEWNEPNNGGERITTYTIARKSTSAPTYTSVFTGSLWPLIHTDTLSSGSLDTYYYKINATNILGTGAYSDEINTTLL